MRERGSVSEKISVCGIEKGRVGKLVYERERERERREVVGEYVRDKKCT